MTFFEGNEFSTIQDEMPSRQWDKAKFFSDWESQIRTKNAQWKDHEIEVAKKTIINGFYSTYEELLQILEKEDLTEEEKNKIRKKTNLAMINVLEYGQRSSKDIVLSLRDRKLPSNEKISDIFNGIIDNLIFEVEKADKEFHDELKKSKKS